MFNIKSFRLFYFIYFLLIFTLYAKEDINNNQQKFLNVKVLQEKIKNIYQNLFTYESLFKDISKNRVISGRFVYQSPYKMQIDFFKNGIVKQQIYFAKDRMTIFSKDLNLICEQTLDEKEDIVVLDKFNFQNWEEEYHIDYKDNFYKKNVFNEVEARKFLLPKNLKAYHLTLHPKDITKGLKSLEFWVLNNGVIIRSRSLSLANQVKDIYFYNIKINKEILPIKFVPPINAQVIQNHLWK